MSTFPDDFDPDHIPRFPIFVLELQERPPVVEDDGAPSTWRALVDGDVVDSDEPTDRDAVTDDGIAEVAARVRDRGWEGVRVDAIAPDRSVWHLIIGPDGERFSLDEPHVTRSPRRPVRRRRWVGWVIALLLLGILGAGGAFGYRYWQATRPQPAEPPPAAATPSAPASPVPAELPTFPPMGASTHARWAYGGLQTEHVVSMGSHVLVVAANRLIAVDATNGLATWAAPIEAGSDGPWLTTVDGVNAVVTTTSRSILVRPLDDLATVHETELPRNAKVSLTREAVWYVDGQDAYIVTMAGGARRTVPAGATVVGANGPALIAMDELGNIWTLDSDAAQTPAPVMLQPPTPGATFSKLLGFKTGKAAVLWEAQDGSTAVGFYQPTTPTAVGQQVLTTPVLSAANDVSTYGEPYDLLSGYLIDYTMQTVTPLSTDFTPQAVLGGVLYGHSERAAWSQPLPTGTPSSAPRAGLAIAPVATADGRMLVLADGEAGRTMYSLEAG